MWFSSTPEISYTHKTNARAKRIKLTVSRTGEVIVTTPRFTPKLFINQFVSQNKAWIDKAKATVSKTSQTVSSNEALLFGKRYGIQIVLSSTEKIGLRIVDDMIIFNPLDDPNKAANTAAIKKSLRSHLERYYKNTISHYISNRLPILAIQMGVTFASIQIREQKTRWGSCSSSGALSFNWRLVHHPPEVIEYVLIHELAHRLQMNHSKAFWDIVRKHCPEYPKHRGWLKRTNVTED